MSLTLANIGGRSVFILRFAFLRDPGSNYRLNTLLDSCQKYSCYKEEWVYAEIFWENYVIVRALVKVISFLVKLEYILHELIKLKQSFGVIVAKALKN